jgi:hypothetical protein
LRGLTPFRTELPPWALGRHRLCEAEPAMRAAGDGVAWCETRIPSSAGGSRTRVPAVRHARLPSCPTRSRRPKPFAGAHRRDTVWAPPDARPPPSCASVASGDAGPPVLELSPPARSQRKGSPAPPVPAPEAILRPDASMASMAIAPRALAVPFAAPSGRRAPWGSRALASDPPHAKKLLRPQ